MIFFGTRGSTVNGSHIPNATCGSCGSDGMHSFGIRRYFHLYWIPTFVTSAKVGVECTHCNRALFDDELEPKIRESLKSTIFTKKAIAPYFTGLFLIAALFISITVAEITGNINAKQYAASPAIGDIYRIDGKALSEFFGLEYGEEYDFTLMEVSFLDGMGNVELSESKYVYETKSGLSKGLRDGEALELIEQDDKLQLQTSTVVELFQSNIIYEIDRS